MSSAGLQTYTVLCTPRYTLLVSVDMCSVGDLRARGYDTVVVPPITPNIKSDALTMSSTTFHLLTGKIRLLSSLKCLDVKHSLLLQ